MLDDRDSRGTRSHDEPPCTDLYDEQGQSPWLDNLKRGWITDGELQRWVERGVRGITSNPSIFQKAMSTGTDYDAQFASLLAPATIGRGQLLGARHQGHPRRARDPAPGLRRSSDGVDGYVSVEVDPALARDTAGTAARRRDLWDASTQPNLYVKIPATAEGVPAIRQMIAEGRNINVTLIFSLERYAEVIEAYISGLEAPHGRRPVAHLERRVVLHQPRRHRGRSAPRRDRHAGRPQLRGTWRGRPGASSRTSCSRTRSPAALGGARRPRRAVQRPLWASTSTKNPAFPDTLYVDR